MQSRAGTHLLEQIVRLDGAQWLDGSEHGDDSAPIGVDHSPAGPACNAPPKA